MVFNFNDLQTVTHSYHLRYKYAQILTVLNVKLHLNAILIEKESLSVSTHLFHYQIQTQKITIIKSVLIYRDISKPLYAYYEYVEGKQVN